MVNENIIPKTETVYELKEEYKVSTFEEFMKTYQSNEASEFLAEAEYQDQALRGPRFGPGNSESSHSYKSVPVSSLVWVFNQTNPLGYRFFFKLSESGSVSYISEKTFYGSGQIRDWLRKIENGTVSVVSSRTLIRNEDEEEDVKASLHDYIEELERVERRNAYLGNEECIRIVYDKRIQA